MGDRIRLRRTAETGGGGEKVHVHIVNWPSLERVFHVTAEQFRGAFASAPELLDRIRMTLGLGGDGYATALCTADVLIAYRFPHLPVASNAPRLKWIHETGAGVDHLLPLDWLPQGVVLTNSRRVHTPKAGDWACCALMMLNSLIPRHITNQRRHSWKPSFNHPIPGRTAVVVGVGTMGGEVARAAKRLGLHVVGVRRSGKPHRHVHEMFPVESFRKVLPRADFVVVTTPLTPETRGLIGRRELDLLKDTAGVVNMARAGVVDYEALMGKLKRNELSGAILDVFDPEPLPKSSPLWDCPNLVITPHVSADAPDYNERMLSEFVDNFRRFISMRALRNRVNPHRGY